MTALTPSQRHYLFVVLGWTLAGALLAVAPFKAVLVMVVIWPIGLVIAFAWLSLAVYLVVRAVREARRAATPLLASLMITAVPAGLLAQIEVRRAVTGHPSDASLITEFRSHQVDFERLLLMFREDHQLGRIASTFTRPANFYSGKPLPADAPVSAKRLAEYRALFAKLGLTSGVEGYDGKDTVWFIRSTRGLSISGSAKGYAYTEAPPQLLVDDLDDYRSGDSRSFTAYRRIEGNWYLYLSGTY